MLYRLEVENFFSIRDQQVLDLSIDKGVPDPDGRYAPIFEGADVRAPKVVALYGANASGKTTLLRALSFIVNMICNSVTHTGFVGIERFNDRESADRPARFAIELGGPMNLTPDIAQRAANGETVEQGTYRYELEIEFKDGLAIGITAEVLRQKPNGRGKWQRVYERDAQGNVKDSKTFSLSGFHHLVKTLAGNHTVLSSFAKFQHPTARLMVEAARNAFFQIEPVQSSADRNVIDYLKNVPALLSRLNDELSRIDVGVEGMRFQNTDNGPLLLFKHAGLSIEMPWALESHGTRAFIKMFPWIVGALDAGGLAAIDELDAAIHPNVLPELLRWFYATSGRNRLDAQLWFSCHSASLLDDLNKEEIVICEKDRQGRSRVYSLMDVKVRRDENHYRKYLSGAYGGVPHFG
ncbi:AAA family ATPase [Rhizobium straminoryzae]|uniref:AAA family ATPase n=1 Tax=Rhizobium straminoryzae TaxID=1387186 RepID=A0A549T7J1_9HYPH|nr:AAA family ATPase [Rhizobium straminoryzae]TRL37820.1 AAA family ATPase [Rhizobium straminoryzae]